MSVKAFSGRCLTKSLISMDALSLKIRGWSVTLIYGGRYDSSTKKSMHRFILAQFQLREFDNRVISERFLLLDLCSALLKKEDIFWEVKKKVNSLTFLLIRLCTGLYFGTTFLLRILSLRSFKSIIFAYSYT